MDNFIGSAAWLEERRKGIGASDCSAVLGINPWRTPYQVYQEKRGELKGWEGDEQANWGLLMEPALRQFYSNQTGRPVRFADKIMFHKKHDFMLASLDGFTDDGRIVELKTARSSKGWGEPGTNEIPDHYALQVHHQMIVTGFEVADVVVSIGGAPPELYEIAADKDLHEMIIEAAAAFWQRVVDGNPPEPTTYADAISRFGHVNTAGTVIAPSIVIEAIESLRTTKEKLDSLKAQEEELKGMIISCLGDSGDTLLSSGGETLCTYKLAKGRETFDSKAFKKDHPELFPQYVKTGEPARRFLLKGEK